MRNKILIGLGAVVLLFAGVTAMASNSIPGDLFYGMKIGFNEKISYAFAGEGRSKVEWHIRAAERRLAEAAEASREGQLTVAGEETLRADFNMHLKVIDEYLTAARAEGKNEEAKEVAVKIGQALAQQVEPLTTAHAEAMAAASSTATTTAANAEGNVSLEFLVLKLTRTLTAAASIAAATMVEDAAPTPEVDPSTVDEWGRPIPGAKPKATTTPAN